MAHMLTLGISSVPLDTTVDGFHGAGLRLEASPKLIMGFILVAEVDAADEEGLIIVVGVCEPVGDVISGLATDLYVS